MKETMKTIALFADEGSPCLLVRDIAIECEPPKVIVWGTDIFVYKPTLEVMRVMVSPDAYHYFRRQFMVLVGDEIESANDAFVVTTSGWDGSPKVFQMGVQPAKDHDAQTGTEEVAREAHQEDQLPRAEDRHGTGSELPAQAPAGAPAPSGGE